MTETPYKPKLDTEQGQTATRGALAGIKTLTSALKSGSVETPDDLLLLNAAVDQVAGILKITTPPSDVAQAQSRILAVVDFLQERDRAKIAIAWGPSSAAGSSGGHLSAAHAAAQLSFGSSSGYSDLVSQVGVADSDFAAIKAMIASPYAAVFN